MIAALMVPAALAVALLAALLAVTSKTTERLLWGAVLCSLGLGVAVQFSQGGYYGIVMLAAFLVTDLIVYLNFRAQNLLPKRPPRNARMDQGYRVFFLWLTLCSLAGAGLFFLQSDPDLLPEQGRGNGVALLHERIWTADWPLLFIPIFSLVVLVMGGFFLVRREK